MFQHIHIYHLSANMNTKPILKWVGGKTQILDTLIPMFPKTIHHYHEPFLGGGSVLLAFLGQVKRGNITLHGNVYAYDLNEPLIYVYKNIQQHPTELFEEIQNRITEYQSCGDGVVNRNPSSLEEALQSKENYYYWVRKSYNTLSSEDKKTIIGSALFVFLNKTCFRGIFRVGPNGFNVPFGNYKNPEIVNRAHLMEIHHLIQGVYFVCGGFNETLVQIEPDDFVYLDPPYAPETKTSFVGYTESGFCLNDHTLLFQHIHRLTEQNTRLIMSNADVDLVRQHFTEDKKYKIHSILCKRSIHSKNPETKTKEVVIQNW
jgi:DNA adenine methylase